MRGYFPVYSVIPVDCKQIKLKEDRRRREKIGMDEIGAMQYEEQGKILRTLTDIQVKSAPIELSIGWVNKNNTVQQGIVIKSAPAVVTKKLVEAGYSLDIMPEGVRVYKI